MSSQPALRVLPGGLADFDGELTHENMAALIARCRELETLLDRADKRVKGLDLRIAQLEADREEEALNDPIRPVVELLHSLHAAATKANPRTPTRRKQLDRTERENAAVCLRKLGLETCVRAVVGITWDPSWSPPRRNGSRECFNTFELCFRNTSKARSFAERAPLDWKPDIPAIAQIAGVGEQWVRDRMQDVDPGVPTQRGAA